MVNRVVNFTALLPLLWYVYFLIMQFCKKSGVDDKSKCAIEESGPGTSVDRHGGYMYFMVVICNGIVNVLLF